LDAALAVADNLGGPPGLIFGPDGFPGMALAVDDGLPMTTAFSQHSFIYSQHTSVGSCRTE